MRTAVGYIVLTLGLMLAIAFIGIAGTHEVSVGVRDVAPGSTDIVRAPELGSEPVAESPDTVTPAERSFAPPAEFVAVAADHLAQASAQETAAAPAPASVPTREQFAWSNPGQRLTSTEPGDRAAERELVRNLQIELRRAGCYSGSVDGVWGGATAEAMSRFLLGANAVLPVDKPDFAHLALVKGHAKRDCAPQSGVEVAAPAATDDPAAAPAIASGEPAPGPEVPGTVPEPDLGGRMAVGGPEAPAAPEVAPELAPEAAPPAAPLPRPSPRRTRKSDDHFIHPLGTR